MAEDRVICGACNREIAADESGRVPALCPHCGTMVIIDDTEEVVPEGPPAEELEERRIRQIVRSRRAVVRTRGWYIAGMLACVVLAVQQLAWFVAAMVRDARGAWDGRQFFRMSLAIVLVAAAVRLRKEVRRLTAELKRSSLPEPATPPDFTSLSDGSQQARNLEELEP